MTVKEVNNQNCDNAVREEMQNAMRALIDKVGGDFIIIRTEPGSEDIYTVLWSKNAGRETRLIQAALGVLHNKASSLLEWLSGVLRTNGVVDEANVPGR